MILSQFFDGIARGFGGLYEADAKHFGIAFRYGVDHAYKSVMTPTEGTILTVLREVSAEKALKNRALARCVPDEDEVRLGKKK